jgi:hypothetical protein
MRAAQLTLEQGGDWFEVVNADTDADAKRRFSTDVDYRTDYAVQRTCGVLGCTDRLVPILTRQERETVELRTVYEHAMEIRVRHGAKPSGAPEAYDAKDTFATLSARLT